MKKIELLGVGGKMGVRISRNVMQSSYHLAPVEVTEAGQARLN